MKIAFGAVSLLQTVAALQSNLLARVFNRSGLQDDPNGQGSPKRRFEGVPGRHGVHIREVQTPQDGGQPTTDVSVTDQRQDNSISVRSDVLVRTADRSRVPVSDVIIWQDAGGNLGRELFGLYLQDGLAYLRNMSPFTSYFRDHSQQQPNTQLTAPNSAEEGRASATNTFWQRLCRAQAIMAPPHNVFAQHIPEELRKPQQLFRKNHVIPGDDRPNPIFSRTGGKHDDSDMQQGPGNSD